MSDETVTDPFSRGVVLDLPGIDTVDTSSMPWGDGDGHTIDIYRPSGSTSDSTSHSTSDSTMGGLGAVVLVTGYPDPGFESMTGRKLKDTAPYVSWARLIAASGLVAVTYTNREPARDAAALCEYLHEHAESLGISRDRLGIWACSGNVPNALSLLTGGTEADIRCAALCYGYMLDSDGSTAVADASRQFGFVVPPVSVEAIPVGLPLLIARAGRDEMPGLNGSIDRFCAVASSAGHTIRLLEHPTGPHAFDVMDESDTSRRVVSDILGFLRGHLLAA